MTAPAGTFSHYWADKVFKATYRATNLTAPANIFLGLTLDIPQKDGTFTEVTAGAYGRQDITSLIDAPVHGEGANNTLIEFTPSGADYGLVKGVIVCDASTSGHMLQFKVLAYPIYIGVGQAYKFDVGQLDFIVE